MNSVPWGYNFGLNCDSSGLRFWVNSNFDKYGFALPNYFASLGYPEKLHTVKSKTIHHSYNHPEVVTISFSVEVVEMMDIEFA